VTSHVLQEVFDELDEEQVSLEGMLLKPNMVIAGRDCSRPGLGPGGRVATLRTLIRHVPPAVPGIVFLSAARITSRPPST
jgi:fructose-bisphosphate aldolase class I